MKPWEILFLAWVGLAVLAWPAFDASAQDPTHPDVPLQLISGVYPLPCMMPSDTDLAEMCALRVDLPGDPLELGCMPHTEPSVVAVLEVTLEVTPGQDARLRCYVVDEHGNRSDDSPNVGFADFTAPSAPVVVTAEDLIAAQELYQARQRIAAQLKSLALSVEN